MVYIAPKKKVDEMSYLYNDILADHNTVKLNLGCGQDIRPIDQGWINADHIEGEGILTLDIFSLPLPFEDNTFDLVFAKHILEHVPHNIPDYGYAINVLQLLVEDIWRILKPGGILHVEGPNGLSSLVGAIDHKRTITPKTFHVFYPDDKWNFYSECRFELVYGHDQIGLGFRVARFLLRKIIKINITPLRIQPSTIGLRKLPKCKKMTH